MNLNAPSYHQMDIETLLYLHLINHGTDSTVIMLEIDMDLSIVYDDGKTLERITDTGKVSNQNF